MEFIYISLLILILLAIFDLIVGVSNDAVNFLNSAIGSKVTTRNVILLFATAGIIVGVTFSSGMMEVARKGIFHPDKFIFIEIITIFLAVMLADILLLDLFNTFGMPTSTTVSIVFELLGAAVAVSLIKIYSMPDNINNLHQYINSAKVLAIISGILLSVVIAFSAGYIVQYLLRLIFTFNYEKRINRYGAIWGGLAISIILYFILVKGAKGSAILTSQQVQWIKENALIIILYSFIVSSILLQVLSSIFKINILKFIVLIGTFALALAFASNDLVNFIGVPLAGLSAYKVAVNSPDLLSASMEALKHPVKINAFYLIVAGIIMSLTLYFSKKARTVTKTEINLGRQDEGLERFEPLYLARVIVRATANFAKNIEKIFPKKIQSFIEQRKNINEFTGRNEKGEIVSFDLIRASSNLVVASALISFATSLKLPLSTTYVTFMVAMGTSLADGAWDRESAVYRVSGVMTVIGGWFLTALIAFTIAFIYALVLYYLKYFGLILLVILTIYFIFKSYIKHKKIEEITETIEVYNLRKIKDPVPAIQTSFEQTARLIEEISASIQRAFNGLKYYDRVNLKVARDDSAKIQEWTNIIVANIFKVLRLLHKMDIEKTQRFSNTIKNLQEIAESYRDIALRSYKHVENHHKGMLEEQLKELEDIINNLVQLLNYTAESLKNEKKANLKFVEKSCNKLSRLISKYDKNQIKRVQNEVSKTRLSILYYAYIVNISKIANSLKEILHIYNETFISKGLVK